jgi:WD40 repeat protein
MFTGQGTISSVAFSPNSQLFASGSSDKTIRFWDPATWTIIQTLTGHLDQVNTIAFAPGSRLLATGSGGSTGRGNDTIRLWDPATELTVKTMDGHSGGVCAVVISPDSQLFASGSEDTTIRLWDRATKTTTETLKRHSDTILSLAFSPNSKLLASGSMDNTIRIWDIATKTTIQLLEGHLDYVCTVAFSPDSRLLASGAGNNNARVVDPVTESIEDSLIPYRIWDTLPGGRLLISDVKDNTVRLWDIATGGLATGTAARPVLRGHLELVEAVVFSPDGRLVASGSRDKTVRLWDVKTGECMMQFTTQQYFRKLSFNTETSSLDTDEESFKLDVSFADPVNPVPISSPLSLDKDKSWIKWNSICVLFLPPDRRPIGFDIRDDIVALGHLSGHLTFLEFQGNCMPVGELVSK